MAIMCSTALHKCRRLLVEYDSSMIFIMTWRFMVYDLCRIDYVAVDTVYICSVIPEYTIII